MKPFVFSFFLLWVFNAGVAQQTIITNLRCEHLDNPIGVDAVRPRFSWQMQHPAFQQQAYELLIGSTPAEAKQGIIWKSGKINSENNLAIYTGKLLKPFTRYYFAVRVYSGNRSYESQTPSYFETGFCGQSWQGAWISDSRDIQQKQAPAFRRSFNTTKKIRSARTYIAAAGLYELYINGHRIGDHRLDPIYTRFDRRNLYLTHDVTAQIKNGENAIGVLLGNGWYNHQSTAVWFFHEAPWRGRPAFCMDLRIEYEDGTMETIATDRSWKTALSPVLFNSIYTAEHYDARLEEPGWNSSGFDDKKWKQVIFRSAPSDKMIAQLMPPIRDVDTLQAEKMIRLNDSVYVFHFPRNIAGVSQLAVSGASGTTVKLKHGEQLNTNGTVDLSNIIVHYRPLDDTDPFQTDIFTLKGAGVELFRPRFNYKGFQYVEVQCSKSLNLSKESLVAYSMHSDVKPAGHIQCHDPLINKIWQATNYSYLANLFGYPTDCPQREKNGWTGDAHIAAETGLYNFDAYTIYEKWMADHRDEQQSNGVLPSIIPTSGWGYEWGNGPDWTSTIAIIPWTAYLFSGDKQMLSDCYDNIKRYVDYITSISPSGLTSWGLGDWVPVKTKTPVEFTSSLYYYTDIRILSKAAKLLNKTADYKKYTDLSIQIQNAFNKKYLDTLKGIYGEGSQTALSTALYWKIVPEKYISKVAASLAKRVEQDGFHLDVGLLGTKAILNALSENGYASHAYKMAAQKDYPSWGWWIENGATTLYENWKIDASSDLSRNHIMFGEIGAWLFKGPGGIFPDETKPGFKHVVLRPCFVEGLESFEASHDGPYGKIISRWKNKNGIINYEAVIPSNSFATVTLPVIAGKKIYMNGKLQAKTMIEIPAGAYTFEIR